MRKKLAVIAAALAIPAGVALAVTAVAAPAQASNSCQELADAYLYHAGIGNYEYAEQLEAWWLAAGCAN